MKKLITYLTLTVMLLTLASCKKENVTPPASDEPTHTHTPAVISEQIPENAPHYTCGNTPTVIETKERTFSFEYGNSLKLSSLIISLDYSEDKLCDCETEMKVTPEFADTYEVSLTNYFVRVNGKQANLTDEEVQLIKKIYDEELNNLIEMNKALAGLSK